MEVSKKQREEIYYYLTEFIDSLYYKINIDIEDLWIEIQNISDRKVEEFFG